MDELLKVLEETRGPLGYLVLGLASLLEYVFPPFPGDTVALFGVFLAATAGYSALGVHLTLTAGAIVGGMMAYAFGRWAEGRRERWPRWMRGERTRKALEKVVARFEEHGAAYLAVNRFLPALRAFFFVGAGLARMPAWKVALYGGISAAAWNGLLLGVGFALGTSFEELEVLYQQYTWVVFAILGAVLVAWLARMAWKKRSSKTDA